MKIVIVLIIGIGVPCGEVNKKSFPVAISFPLNMNEVKSTVERIYGTLDGILLHNFRNFSVTTFQTVLGHLTIEAECNGIHKTIIDDNYAVPVSETELSDWIEKTCKPFPNAVRNLLFEVALSLLQD